MHKEAKTASTKPKSNNFEGLATLLKSRRGELERSAWRSKGVESNCVESKCKSATRREEGEREREGEEWECENGHPKP
jgi:hypothetical protein